MFFDAAAISLCWFLKWALFDGTGPYNTLISLALTLAVRRCMRMKKDQQNQEAPSFTSERVYVKQPLMSFRASKISPADAFQ